MSFMGMLARKCGINDPDTFIMNIVAVDGEESAGSSSMLSLLMSSALASSASSKFAPSLATTITTTMTMIDYAGAMKTLCQCTSTFVPPPRTSSTRAAFDDIAEIMD